MAEQRDNRKRMNNREDDGLNSKLIAELARKRPTTEEELRLIPGIGERRIAKHGEALLALIRAYE